MSRYDARHFRYPALLLALFLGPWSLFSQTRDYWLKTERKGTGYSYEHVSVTKLPDGNLRYESLSHFKMNFSRMNPEDIVMSGSYIVDPELRPLSFEGTWKSQAKDTHTTGIRAGNRMKVTVQDSGGQPEERDIDIEGAYFDPVLGDLIARRAQAGSFSLKLFDASGANASTTQVEILTSSESEVTASLKAAQLTRWCRVARDGRLVESKTVELGSHTYVADAREAQDIGYLDTADGFSLTVHSQRSFPNVYKVTRAQVRVRWKSVPFAEFSLKDNRQRIVRESQSGEQFEVVLETIAPASVPLKAARAPAAPPPREIADVYLGEDNYIKPRDSAIRKQAAEIVGEAKDPSEAVGKLLQWVNANVKPDLIADTLTGPEVLRKRRGKCSEYAILFASLARAAGIPTRIALGVSYSGREWVGHMWDEVWLGEWTAVDAGNGVFAGGPSILKFTDSPTVDGTRGVRYKLVDNLEIEILDFEAAKGPASLTTGISGATYVNASYACRISAPDSSWTLTEKSEGGQTLLSMKDEPGGIQFALVLFAIPPGTAPGTILEARLGGIEKVVPSFKPIETGEMEVGGRKAPSAVFSLRREGGETKFNQNIVLVDGTSGYLFAWIVPQEKFAALDGVLRKILGSFELVKQ